MCGIYFKRKHRIAKHMQIKDKHFLVPSRRYQDSRHLLKNPKVPKNVMGFINRPQRSTSPYYLDVDNPLAHLSCLIKSMLWKNSLVVALDKIEIQL